MNAKDVIGEALQQLIADVIDARVGKTLRAIDEKLDDILKMVVELYSERGGDQLLNKGQACKLLKVSYPTLRGLIKRGIITPIVSDKKTIRFSRRVLVDALQKREQTTISPITAEKIYREVDSRERVDKAKHYYVRGIIKKSFKQKGLQITNEDIPDGIVKLKRDQILLNRAIKEQFKKLNK